MKKKITRSQRFNNLCIQIFKFVTVGIIATLIDFLLLFVFKEICYLNTILSNTLSFSISVIYNYIASVKWVFNVNKNQNKYKNFIVFISLSVIGLLVNDIIMYLCTRINIYYLIAKIIATLIVMVFNFITRKLFLE